MNTQKIAPGFAANESQAPRKAEAMRRDARTGPNATQAEESGFMALVAEMERRTGLPMFENSEPELAPIGYAIRSNVTRGRCVLCGGRGGDTITPVDPCPMCGKERGE